MSPKTSGKPRKRRRVYAPIFAALGDETRLLLLAKLGAGHRLSIAQLTDGSKLTRQAITKHLHVLENVKIARHVRSGRESLFELDPQPVEAARDYLQSVAEEWDEALFRLKSFVEKPE
jgi:DNA-binding transcriptional ArsR family regulator